jgi:hypothetical protein
MNKKEFAKKEKKIEEEFWNTATESDVVYDKKGNILRFINERKVS